MKLRSPPRPPHFEGVVAHEIGHVLGVDHPDQSFRLDPDAEFSVHDHVRIHSDAPCKGLRAWKVPAKRCEALGSGAACAERRDCRVRPAAWRADGARAPTRCASIFEETVMFSRVGAESSINPPTEDDLAAVFFASVFTRARDRSNARLSSESLSLLRPRPPRRYPDALRDRNGTTWGTAPLRLAEYSLAKLRGIAEDALSPGAPGSAAVGRALATAQELSSGTKPRPSLSLAQVCRALATAQELVECIAGARAQASLAELDRMVSRSAARARARDRGRGRS